MPHKMNCSDQLLENDQKVVCRKAYHKKYAKNRECILAQQKRWLTGNIEILKNGCKNGMKTTRNGSSAAREFCSKQRGTRHKLPKTILQKQQGTVKWLLERLSRQE